MQAFVREFSIATGTGRCGTQFLAKLLSLSNDVATRHDPDPLNLAFHRYCKWYGLPVDNEGFLGTKAMEIEQDLAKAKLSVHSSAHMALSIEDLYERFNCRVIVFYRHPANVVNSYMGKGLYQETYVQRDMDKAMGFQPVGRAPHHFFSRTVPRGEYFATWNQLTRVGKIAWMWSAVNREILRQIAQIPKGRRFVSRIEDFNYTRYVELAAFLGIDPVNEETFISLSRSRPNKLRTSNDYLVQDWSAQERKEFIDQVGELCAELGYSTDIEAIIRKEPRVAEDKKIDNAPHRFSFRNLMKIFRG